MTVIFDTNIFIYLAKGTLSVDSLPIDSISFASITRIEALGYLQIKVSEFNILDQLFRECDQLDLDEDIINRAILLRQYSKIALGDSIIAATALEKKCQLWTANEDDFKKIPELEVVNPLRT